MVAIATSMSAGSASTKRLRPSRMWSSTGGLAIPLSTNTVTLSGQRMGSRLRATLRSPSVSTNTSERCMSVTGTPSPSVKLTKNDWVCAHATWPVQGVPDTMRARATRTPTTERRRVASAVMS